MTYDKIPQELKNLRQWGLYHREWNEDKGKYNKTPVNPWDGTQGKSNDPTTWADFNQALSAMDKFPQADGLAFFFGNGYAGLDIDHIKDEMDELGATNSSIPDDNIILRVAKLTHYSYMEKSMSGEGIHVIFRGKIQGDRRRKDNFEMYDSGRFFALTGNSALKKAVIANLNNDDMKRLEIYCFGKPKVVPINNGYNPADSVDLSTDDILSRAFLSQNGSKIKDLYDGNWQKDYSSQSEADMAFANYLAFWTGKDFSKMDEIFRESGLMRDKYDEKRGKTTYGEGLLNKAINETADTYHPKEDLPNYNLAFLNNDSEKKIPERSWDDMGNGQRLVDAFGDVIRYSYVDKKWYVFGTYSWGQDEFGWIEKLADAVINALPEEPISMNENLDDKEKAKVIKSWNTFKKKTRSRVGKKNMVDEAKHLVSVQHDEFDRDKMYLNTKSGYVDLSTGELHDTKAENMFSQVTGAEWTDKADCPEWLHFLNVTFDGDQGLIHFFQKAFGYTLTGSIKEQVMFVCYGDGRNGKSVLLNIMQAVAGGYAKTMSAESIMVKRGQSGPNSDIARLESARMVVSSESNEGARLDESLVKSLTGGEKIVARYLYGSEFEFKPKFKMWMASNHKPTIRGTDKGIWRRIELIPFTHTVSDEEMDKDLEDKLMRELPGITAWAVEGALMWQKEGLNPPAAVVEAGKAYRQEMDVVERFVDECCELMGESKSSELFRTYKDWCIENNEYCMSNQKFSKELEKKGYKKRHTRIGTLFEGIQIQSDSRLNFLNS